MTLIALSGYGDNLASQPFRSPLRTDVVGLGVAGSSSLYQTPIGNLTSLLFPGVVALIPSGGDDGPILSALTSPAILVGGQFQINSMTTVSQDIVVFGATIHIQTGFTLAFHAAFSAPIGPMFVNATAGLGTVTFRPAFLTTGYPEWWGAVSNSNAGGVAVANLAALTACVVACPVTQLQGADYYVSGTWKIATGNRDVCGVSYNGGGVAPSTRIIVTSATLDCIQVGPDTLPGGGPNNFLQNVRVRDVTCARTLAPTPPVSGFLTGPAGLRAQFLLSCRFENIWTLEHFYGMYLTGLVYTFFDDCHHQRQSQGSTAVNDGFFGFFVDYTPSFGDNGGNASLYITRGGAQQNSALSLSYSSGLYTYAGFVDTFITQLETSGCQVGLNFNGPGSGAFATEDLQVSNCVLDSCTVAGIIVNAATAVATAYSITGCYIGLGAGTPTGILIWHGTAGCGTLVANQVIGAVSSGPNVGLQVNGASGVVAQGNIYTDCLEPILLIGSNNCKISDIVSNYTEAATVAAIQLTSTSRCVIDCIVKPGSVSAAPAYPLGIDMIGSSNTFNEVRMSSVDAGGITSGSANKLVSNGTQITSAGVFSTNNLAQGIMA